MSTSSMLHARNNLSVRHDIAESAILRWPEVCQAGRRTNRMHAGSAVFKTQSEAVVLLPGKQHEWKEAQEVRNGSFASLWPCFIHFRSSPSNPGRMLKGAIGGP